MTLPTIPTVDQSSARAGGDVVGRDKTEVHNHAAFPKQSKLEKLKARLEKEVADGNKSHQIVEELLSFKRIPPDDGVSGLQAKLEISGRAEQVMAALEMKEQFAKQLDRWSLYMSAQEIFVHLLAMAECNYKLQIYPLVETLSQVEIDELIEKKIVVPAIEDVGIDVFSLNHKTAMGMIYWLADNCRIRWHK